VPPEATPPVTPDTAATATPPVDGGGASPSPDDRDAVAAWAAEGGEEATTETPATEPAAEAAKTEEAAAETPTPSDTAETKELRSALRRERQALEREKAAKAVLDKATEFDDVMSDASKLLAAANKRGVSTKALLDAVIAAGAADPEPTAEKKLETEVAAIKDELAQERQRRAAADYQRVATEIKTKLQAEPKRFGLIDAFDAHERVLKGIAQYYKVNGEDPDPADIADMVVKQLRKEKPAPLVAHMEKFYNPPAETATPDPQRPPQPATLGKTLTNTAGGRPPPSSEEDPFPLDTDERLAAITKAGW
jgi:hypothetical protein